MLSLPNGFADADTSALEPLAQAVLDARAAHTGATLADLYDPDLMPPNLRRAHHALDRAVDRLYRRKRFTSERERVEYLFALYERMQAPAADRTHEIREIVGSSVSLHVRGHGRGINNSMEQPRGCRT